MAQVTNVVMEREVSGQMMYTSLGIKDDPNVSGTSDSGAATRAVQPGSNLLISDVSHIPYENVLNWLEDEVIECLL